MKEWQTFDPDDACDGVDSSGLKVYKCGISTLETIGVWSETCSDGSVRVVAAEGKEPYSLPGDSGALVFLKNELNKLFPVGVHYSGQEGRVGWYIPLRSIFDDFMKKQGLKEIDIRFLSPPMNGKVTLILSV